MDKYTNYANLIKLSEELQRAPEIEKPNFFSITGYSHHENLISNVLQFFFDTTSEHNLSDLWIKCLLECYKTNSESQSSIDINWIGGPYNTFGEVQREFLTEDRKRLDLVINLGDRVIAIENKIYAGIYNPFDSYHREIKKEYPDLCDPVEIVLSIADVRDEVARLNKDYSTHFVNVTYPELIERIKKNIGEYLLNANQHWLIFMNEFLTDLNSLCKRSSINMDEKWQELIDNNRDDFTKFISYYFLDIDRKIDYIKSVNDSLNGGKFAHGIVGHQSGRYFSVYVNIPRGNRNTIAVEAYYMRVPTEKNNEKPGYLYIAIWERTDMEKPRQINFEQLKYDIGKDFNEFSVVNYGDSWQKHLLKVCDSSIFSDSDNLTKELTRIANLLDKTEA